MSPLFAERLSAKCVDPKPHLLIGSIVESDNDSLVGKMLDGTIASGNNGAEWLHLDCAAVTVNTLVISVLARTREIGLLRAYGPRLSILGAIHRA